MIKRKSLSLALLTPGFFISPSLMTASCQGSVEIKKPGCFQQTGFFFCRGSRIPESLISTFLNILKNQFVMP
jgi:hypothetical protein